MAIDRQLFLNIANYYRQKRTEDEARAAAASSRNFNPFNAIMATVLAVLAPPIGAGMALGEGVATVLGSEYLRTQGEIVGAPNEARIAASSILNRILTARRADAGLQELYKGTYPKNVPTTYDEFKKTGSLGVIKEVPLDIDTAIFRFANAPSEVLNKLSQDLAKKRIEKQLFPDLEKPVKKTTAQLAYESGEAAPEGYVYGRNAAGDVITEKVKEPEEVKVRPSAQIIIKGVEYPLTFDNMEQKNAYLELMSDLAASVYQEVEDPKTKKLRRMYSEDAIDQALQGKNKEYNSLPASIKIMYIQKVKETLTSKKAWFK